MFNNEEDNMDNNDKYIMFSKEEKDMKIEATSFDNEIKIEHQNELNNDEEKDIIPPLQYKSEDKEKIEEENIDKENNTNNNDEINHNILSNDYDEVKMNIKNYLKEKISQQNNEIIEIKEKDNIENNSNYDDKKNLTDICGNSDMNIKNTFNQVQITNSSISKGLKNVVINSTKSSIESIGNSVDNYIQMENLYLQDGKINSTTTNYENSNTNNLTTNNNISLKNSKNSYNKLNEMAKEEMQNYLKRENIEEENIINAVNNEDDEEDNLKNYNNNNIISNTNNKNIEEIDDDNNNINNIINNNLNINYNDLYAESQQKIREERTNELKLKAKKKIRAKIHDEIYKKEYNNIVNKIHQELEFQLKDELNTKLIEELNYIRKKESFNQKIKMEQIDNEIKEKVKNEFEEELNKELILKEKEIKIKYNQKLENFRKKFKK